MAEKWKEQATIVRQDEIAIDIYSIGCFQGQLVFVK